MSGFLSGLSYDESALFGGVIADRINFKTMEGVFSLNFTCYCKGWFSD